MLGKGSGKGKRVVAPGKPEPVEAAPAAPAAPVDTGLVLRVRPVRGAQRRTLC